jgi:riboflavin biosynthesis pyrimidine reductase
VAGAHPARVVLDPQGKLRSAQRLLLEDAAAPTLVLTAAECAPAPHERRGADVEWLTCPVRDGCFELQSLRDLLRARGLSRLFIEGGGVTVSHFLAAGMLDRLHVSVAPLILGSGAPAFVLPPIERLDQALPLRCRHFALGPDLLFDCQLLRRQPVA